MESLNEKIKRIRKEKGISQVEVAKASGINQASYSNIEKGSTTSISIEVGKGIAKALEIPFNDLFEIEALDENIEIVRKLAKEYEEAKQLTDELNERLNDKKTILSSYQDSMDYVKYFIEYSFQFIDENENITALDLFAKVHDRIQKEKGYVGLVVDKENGGLNVRFLGNYEDIKEQLKKFRKGEKQ